MQISPMAKFFNPQVMKDVTSSCKQDAPEVADAVKKSRRKLRANLLRKTPPSKNVGGNLDISQ